LECGGLTPLWFSSKRSSGSDRIKPKLYWLIPSLLLEVVTHGKSAAAAGALQNLLEISLALFVTAIAIEFDCVTRPFTGCAAIFSAFLRRTRARWILAFVFVSHDSSPRRVTFKDFYR
jgi:hypothetical protein